MINPTGGKIRIDALGDGRHGAPRGKRSHNGVDYECTPGQSVKAPHGGRITRVAYPYASDMRWKGCVIEGLDVTTKMFYLDPNPDLIGTTVLEGQHIGAAQNISKKYPGMTPHVHLRVTNVDPELLMGKRTEMR